MRRRRGGLWRLGLAILVIVALIVFVYALPRFMGDRFASALIRLNLVEAKDYLCPDMSIGQVASLFGGEDTLGAWLAQQLQGGIQIPGWSEVAERLRLDSAYYPFTGIYTVSYVMEQTVEIGGFKIQGGVSTPPVTLGVRRLSPISFCLTTA